jgi:hypothetical protein
MSASAMNGRLTGFVAEASLDEPDFSADQTHVFREHQSTRFDETFEQFLLRALARRIILWVPLHTDHPTTAAVLDGLDHSVGCRTRNHEVRRQIFDGLMMKRMRLLG